MKQVIVLVAMIIVGLALFTGVVALRGNSGEAIKAADTQVENIAATVPAIQMGN